MPSYFAFAALVGLFWTDPARQIEQKDKWIETHGGAQETPIEVPRLSSSEKAELLEAFYSLSATLNDQGIKAVNGANAFIDETPRNPSYDHLSKVFESESGMQESAYVSQKLFALYSPQAAAYKRHSEPVTKLLALALQDTDRRVFDDLAQDFARIRDALKCT